MEFEKQLEEWMKLDYVLPEDLPNIELYMDQVTTFLEEQLKNTKRFEEDKIFTKTMINNYTKNHLLPPSNKKKYSRNHMILLIYIYYLKNFLSISDIKNLLDPLNEHFDDQERILFIRFIMRFSNWSMIIIRRSEIRSQMYFINLRLLLLN